MTETDVLLINPIDETQMKKGLGISAPPLGLMYLAAALEKESIKAKIIDDNMYQEGINNITNIASKINPKIIGVTATTATIKNALGYINSLRSPA
jgi:anaerobic magnesium-protoporphyrin IX monomethyl ester cyclase